MSGAFLSSYNPTIIIILCVKFLRSVSLFLKLIDNFNCKSANIRFLTKKKNSNDSKAVYSKSKWKIVCLWHKFLYVIYILNFWRIKIYICYLLGCKSIHTIKKPTCKSWCTSKIIDKVWKLKSTLFKRIYMSKRLTKLFPFPLRPTVTYSGKVKNFNWNISRISVPHNIYHIHTYKRTMQQCSSKVNYVNWRRSEIHSRCSFGPLDNTLCLHTHISKPKMCSY